METHGILQHTVNQRAVHIILVCILVNNSSQIADKALLDMKVAVDSMISSEEKGHSNTLTPEGAREELDRRYSRNAGVDRCVLATFGSAWATMKVNCFLLSINKFYGELQRHYPMSPHLVRLWD